MRQSPACFRARVGVGGIGASGHLLPLPRRTGWQRSVGVAVAVATQNEGQEYVHVQRFQGIYFIVCLAYFVL